MDIIFTEHAKQMIEKRRITKEDVINAVKYPEETKKKEGKYYVQKALELEK